MGINNIGFYSKIKVYYSAKRLTFIVMNNPFSIKAKPYAVLKVRGYKGVFP